MRPSLMLGALGIVYGDLGTSPLYVMKAVGASLGKPLTPETALGSLSLIVWTLIVTISFKYCVFVMRADHHGEGGILALMSLIDANTLRGKRWALAAIGLAGAALIYGDGIITPSISVLSALEGLTVAAPTLSHVVLPGAVGILVVLFLGQQFGTATIGKAFGPIMLLWFVVIAALGLANLWMHPSILAALNPVYIIRFFQHGGWRAFLAMGGIFLCVTGGEALYADMGHFGRGPIRGAWYGLVLPALILNYAGQIARLSSGKNAISNPFFAMGPSWAIYPLVVLATLATIIASQAIITGAFSLTRQAMQLGWLPGMKVEQTSDELYGQIYVPAVNYLMMLGTLGLTIAFGSSSRLAGAYGIAVSTTMLSTTILLAAAMNRTWKWPSWRIVPPIGLFLVVDIAYFAANLAKITHGGWIPLLFAALIFSVMTTWRSGMDIVHRRMAGSSCEDCIELLKREDVPRVPGAAVFLTRAKQAIPSLLTQHIRHMGALQETVIVLSVVFVTRPRVAKHDRVRLRLLGQGLWRATARFGYLERTDLMSVLEDIKELKHLDFRKVIYFGARDLVVRDPHRPRLSRWRLALFGFLFRNAAKTMDRFHIPPENFVEIAREVRV